MSISPEIAGVIGIIILIILLFARMWIGFAMGLTGFLGFAYLSGFDSALNLLAIIPYRTLADYTISMIPLFVLMAMIVGNTGIAGDLYKTAHVWMGHLRGGLAMATTAACAAFAAICGDSLSGTVVMGKVAVPEMKQYGYDESLATGCVAAGGTLGFLIPPSLAFVLYGILTEVSIGALFVAGIFPGLLLTAFFIGGIAIMVRTKPQLAPAGPKSTFKEKIISLKYTWAMLVLFLLVLGGIYGGVFTPTEAAAIGAFGAVVITTINKRLNRKNLVESLFETAQVTGMVLTIILGAFLFMRFLSISKLPMAIAGVIGGLTLPPHVIFAVIVVAYIIIGMFLHVIPVIVLSIPIIYPAILALGFDPVWFGVIIVLIIEMGLITPPVGLNVYTLAAVTGTPIGTVFRGITPFVIAEVLCVVVLTIFPQIVLFLPNTM